MPNNLIDHALENKPLEFYKEFENQIADRMAAIVDNQKKFFAQNYFGSEEAPKE